MGFSRLCRVDIYVALQYANWVGHLKMEFLVFINSGPLLLITASLEQVILIMCMCPKGHHGGHCISPSTVWVLGIERKSSALAAGTILLVPKFLLS